MGPSLLIHRRRLVGLACAARGNGEDPPLMAILEIRRDAEKKRPFRVFKRIGKGVEKAGRNKTEKRRRQVNGIGA
jgi:hypothetical protein